MKKMNKVQTYIKIALVLALSLCLSADTIDETPYNNAELNIGKGKPVLFEFGAESCPGCRTMGKTLFNIKQDNPEYEIKYINIYADKRVIDKYEISAIPMQVIYDKDGNEVFENVGVLYEEELKEILKTHNF